MKKQFHLSFLLLGAIGIAYASQSDDASGHTFFSIQNIPWQTPRPEKISLFRHRGLARECGWGGAFQVAVFGGRSTQSKDLAKYFMYCGKTELVVDSNASNLERDVNPFHFNIDYGAGSFKSTIKFRPRHEFYGIGFQYIQYLGWNDCCERKWWVDFSAPIIHVRNDMNLTEEIDQQGTTGTPDAGTNANMIEAFKGLKPLPAAIAADPNELMLFGRIDVDKKLKKTALAFVAVKLGYDYLYDECKYLAGYVGFVVNTGNKPKGEFVFEPIVGYNRHWGVMWGAYAGMQVWQDCDKCVRWEFAINSRYLLKNTQVRSMDLKFRPWSRYLLIYKNQQDAVAGDVSFGIDTFTRKVEVRPRYSVQTNTAFVYSSCAFEAELGWNFWASQAERVKLKEEFAEGPAVAQILANNTVAANTINRLSNIGNDNLPGVAYSDDARIKAEDLNLESASQPCAMSHIFYGTIGHNWDNCTYPTFVGVGGSYEYAVVNTAINRWLIWGKFGVSI